MNLKLIIALLSVGILCLVGATAVVASLPSAASSPRTTQSPAKTVSQSRSLASGRSLKTHGHSSTTTTTRPVSLPTTTTTARVPRTTTPPTVPPATTPMTSAVPPSTAFVLTTITYEVKTGDTLGSIQNWFSAHGYGVQFDANLQVIEDNADLLVPGALISISNGVMTIHSPL
ncbi:MAG: hypothetical protein WAM97_14860 [Acidimicrobiales bacterium]